ncbi:MAG: hypothetical protein ABIO72_00875 [Patescibacteria group bacterium]
MQSFERAPGGPARVKPIQERGARFRRVDSEPPAAEEEAPITRRSGKSHKEEPKNTGLKWKEDVEKVEEIQEQIKKPELVSELQTLKMYSAMSIQRAQNNLGQLNMAARTSALTPASFEDFRRNLLIDRDYLMDLQRHSLSQSKKSEALREIQEEIHKNIIDIQEGIHEADMQLREQAVTQKWSTAKPWASEQQAAMRNATVDDESAALANKFNTSAKQMAAKQKSGLWSRFKSFFS